MPQPAVKFDPKTWARIERAAAAAGYASPREFVVHAIEKELERLESAPSKDELIRRMKGLGYLE